MKQQYEKDSSKVRRSQSKREKPQWFNVRSLFDESVASVGVKKPHKKVNFKVSVTSSTPDDVHGNGKCLRQLLICLLDLAQKQVGVRDSIYVSCEATNRRLGGITLNICLLWSK